MIHLHYFTSKTHTNVDTTKKITVARMQQKQKQLLDDPTLWKILKISEARNYRFIEANSIRIRKYLRMMGDVLNEISMAKTMLQNLQPTSSIEKQRNKHYIIKQQTKVWIFTTLQFKNYK